MLPFPAEVQKTQKHKDFGVLGKQRPESKICFFFAFFLLPVQENARFWWKMLPFPEEVQKKILQSWKQRPEESNIFVFWF